MGKEISEEEVNNYLNGRDDGTVAGLATVRGSTPASPN
jgi:hypothetical protein